MQATKLQSTVESKQADHPPAWYADVKPGDLATWAGALVALVAMGVALWAARKASQDSERTRKLMDEANRHADRANQEANKANQIAEQSKILNEKMLLVVAGQS